MGSGYPADPTTKAFLQDNIDKVFGYPCLVRFSWGTIKKILEEDKKAAECVWEEAEEGGSDDDEAVNATPAITEFFKRKDDGDHVDHVKSRAKKTQDSTHRFFVNRNLNRVTSIKELIA